MEIKLVSSFCLNALGCFSDLFFSVLRNVLQVTTGTPRGSFWENASHVIATATQISACQALGYAL